MNLEKTHFDLNIGCWLDEKKGKPHIHWEECYAMFGNNRSGMAKIIRALKSYHHPNKLQQGDLSDSFVGEPHRLCIALEELQYLRFQTL